MKYPYTSISKVDMEKENGSPVYSIWRHIGPSNCSIKGYIAKTRWGTWQIEMTTRYYAFKDTERPTFKEAKELARSFLD